ncbi:efflux RND transporter periplasmic adaptor subunit [Gymnodinialimonas sp. 2305UL16-5]|uniref:efflux RND transporter periplasmic adaptor subunit n=1 Tax=Gymnodinialimonas mytili TaxID=3126503 RepID=UPI0030A86F59
MLAPLEAQSYALTLRAIGTATSLRSVDVVATESGQIVELRLPQNGHVDAGDILVQLDDTSEQLELEIALAERDLAEATLDRYATLAETGIRTSTDADLTDARVALRLAEANVALSENTIEDRVIRAPISGQLGLSDLQIGDYLDINDPVISVEDSSVIIAEFEVPERSIGLLEAGLEVLIGTPTHRGRIFHGEIIAYDTQLDSVTRSVTVQAEVDNSDGLLWAGMSFAVRIIEETDPMPVVPSTAITWAQDGAGIWLVEDDRATRHSVTIRYRDGDQIWIETEAPLGAQVVVEGGFKLRDGTSVTAAGIST